MDSPHTFSGPFSLAPEARGSYARIAYSRHGRTPCTRVYESVCLFSELPRRVLLGNSEGLKGMKKAGGRSRPLEREVGVCQERDD